MVAEILRDVRARGDRALLDYNRKFEGAALTALEVTAEETDAALAALDPAFLRVLERAAANIRAFHEKQRRTGFRLEADGRVLGQRVCRSRASGSACPAEKRRSAPPC